MIAEYSAKSGVTVWGSLQCPYYVHKSLRAVFDLPEEKVRVIQTETGGAFGGKEDYPSTLACARGAAGHEERPSGEDGLRPHGRSGRDHQAPSFARAPPHRARSTTASCWRWISISPPTAALTPRSRPPCCRAPRCTRPAPTSAPTCACARAPGPPTPFPTAHFAASARRRPSSPWSATWMRSPRRIGMDPVELRRRNFLHDGDTNATEQVMREPVILDQAARSRTQRERLPRQARAIRARESRRVPSSAAWASPRSITAPASPARASAI